MTLFRVKNHAPEFEAFVDAAPLRIPPYPGMVSPDDAAANAEDVPNAERIEEYSRDYIVETLLNQVSGHEFERLVAQLLEAMGYRARVTEASGDGGVDVIAHRDPLGLEPPIVKVQCKRTVDSVGAPKVQSLIGTLAPGGSELGLFVTLGSYSKDAVHLERTRQDLRLVSGNELVELVFENYERLSPEWKRLLPLRRVYVVDQEPEAV